MRITVVSAHPPSEASEVLRDLGCALREAHALDAPDHIARGVDAVVVETADDAEVARFVLGRLRGAGSRVPVLLAVKTSQLTRVDPSWPFDDLILQPYVPQELYVRLRALEWRASDFAQPERVKVGALVLDPSAHEARVEGRTVELTHQEFLLILYLARRRGQVSSRELLLREVWGVRGHETRTLDVHIRRLRAKLGPSVSIETVRGVGYRLPAPDAT